MNVSQYREEVDALAGKIAGMKSCVNDEEVARGLARLYAAWKSLSLTEQPKRINARDKERADRVLAKAANMFDELTIQRSAGVERSPITPPAKAMEDTMRFCATAKRIGSNSPQTSPCFVIRVVRCHLEPICGEIVAGVNVRIGALWPGLC